MISPRLALASALLMPLANAQLHVATPLPNKSPLDPGNQAWLLISTALVFLMVPGLGFFYSGISEAKNSMTMLVSVMLAFSVAAIEWALMGFSLALSDTSGSKFIGNFQYGGLLGTIETSNLQAPTIPNSLFAMYQMMFASITPALFLGSVGGRMKMAPMMLFVLFWSIIVYNPIVYWVWSANGWLKLMNVMDYAGGSVVHVSSGTTAIVLALMIGKRVDYNKRKFVQHSPMFVYLGTGLLWFGWNGFNGGSSFAANSRATNASFASNLAAVSGGLVWVLLEMVVEKKGFSTVAFCTGAIAGLATITAGAGFVQPGFGIIYGILAAITCFYCIELCHHLHIDDSLDVMAVHGVGGILGMILTGIFAQHTVTNVFAPGSTAGWVDHVWIQVPVQLAAIAAVGCWSVAWSVVFFLVIEKVFGMKFRCTREEEVEGLDRAELKEIAKPPAYSKISGMEEGVKKTVPIPV
ncbi:hypothetical protein HDU98_004579 [Podochytrium sp. JEL0797]|nr:hypothetical protein HDU98_004579 [Podochytrium sp. JEL0797]